MAGSWRVEPRQTSLTGRRTWWGKVVNAFIIFVARARICFWHAPFMRAGMNRERARTIDIVALTNRRLPPAILGRAFENLWNLESI